MTEITMKLKKEKDQNILGTKFFFFDQMTLKLKKKKDQNYHKTYKMIEITMKPKKYENTLRTKKKNDHMTLKL